MERSTGLVVAEIWRFPVKSMAGERVETVEVEPTGIVGDRAWGLRHAATGTVLTARRRPELLFASARIVDGGCVITLPDGTETDDDATLSAWLGDDVELVAAADGHAGTYEVPLDTETEAAESWVSWTGPGGSFHDSQRSRVSFVSESTLGDWDRRRFRTNLILTGSGEDALIGARVRIGSVDLEVNKAIDRCVMVTRPQPGLNRDLDVLRTINRERASNLAVGANPLADGSLSIGDEIIETAPPGAI